MFIAEMKTLTFVADVFRTNKLEPIMALALVLTRASSISESDSSILSPVSWGSRYSDWLRAGRPRGRSSSPGRIKNFLQVFQTGSGVHPTSYQMGTGALSPGVKRPGPEADHLHLISAEVNKIVDLYIHSPIRHHGVVLN
jgi:hypothetical protein